MPQRVLILGASGFLGENLRFFLRRDSPLNVYGAGRSRTWSTDIVLADYTSDEVERVIVEKSIDVVINCVGAVGHTKVELDPGGSAIANIELAGLVASVTNRLGVRLIHFSSDSVYSGALSAAPFTESSSVAPFSLYGEQKAKSEQRVLEENSESLILRVNFFGWSSLGNSGVLDHFVISGLRGQQPIGYTDYVVSSVYTADLANVVRRAIEMRISGTYNLGSSDGLSKYEFGQAVFMALGLDSSQIVRGNPSAWPSLGVTHRDLTMSSIQIEAALSIEVPRQREGISSALKDLAGFLECCHAPTDDVRYSVVQAVLS